MGDNVEDLIDAIKKLLAENTHLRQEQKKIRDENAQLRAERDAAVEKQTGDGE